MKFTIREINNGIATVDFEDGAWAEVPMNADDSEEIFSRNVEGYVTKTFKAPEWSLPEATVDGSTVEREIPSSDPSPVDDVILLQWMEDRIRAYGSPASQLEFITENGLEAWQEEVAAIKKNFPATDGPSFKLPGSA
tara:strand:+ start:700 stop:1110 length:411 start_codon:yes stop_codon:yes gene_type:complete